MINKINVIEMEVDWSTLFSLLDDVSEHVNGLPNKKLKKFIKSAFYLTNNLSNGKVSFNVCHFRAKTRYLELIPSLMAGDITFDNLYNMIICD
jgi:hypothetical protein